VNEHITLAVLVIAALAFAPAAQGENWNGSQDPDLNWSTLLNWDEGTVPNGVDAVARSRNLNPNPTLDIPVTLGSFSITPSGNTPFTINGPGSLTFDVTGVNTSQTEIRPNNKNVIINANVILNDDDLLLANIQGGSVNFKGAFSGANDIYVAPNIPQTNADRFILGQSSDLSGFTGDIYLMDQDPAVTNRYAIMSARDLSATELVDTIIYMGENSRLDGVRSSNGIVAANIVVQKDAFFWTNGNKGGFTTVGVISGAGNLGMFTDNGGPRTQISGTAPNTMTGNVDIWGNDSAAGLVRLSKDGALGTAPTLTVRRQSVLEITSSGADEDRIWDETEVYLQGDVTGQTIDGIYSKIDLYTDVSETVGALYLWNSVTQAYEAQPDGTYGSTSAAGATYQLDEWFKGAGILTVASAVPTLPGDANDSGFVDDDDLAVLLSNWEQDPGTITTWALGDFTGDTDVDDDDLAVLLGNWTGPPPGGAAVPEPATLALLGLGGLSVLRRRRS